MFLNMRGITLYSKVGGAYNADATYFLGKIVRKHIIVSSTYSQRDTGSLEKLIIEHTKSNNIKFLHSNMPFI